MRNKNKLSPFKQASTVLQYNYCIETTHVSLTHVSVCIECHYQWNLCWYDIYYVVLLFKGIMCEYSMETKLAITSSNMDIC